MSYLYRVGLSLSVLFNVILGGSSNQTFSARNYDWQKFGKPNITKLIDLFLGKGHCRDCWVYWITRKDKW